MIWLFIPIFNKNCIHFIFDVWNTNQILVFFQFKESFISIFLCNEINKTENVNLLEYR